MGALLLPLAGQMLAEEITAPDSAWRPGEPMALKRDILVLDLSARARMEVRDNTFDFDSATRALTDDVFLLERVRIGLTIRPSERLTLRIQAQDAREIGAQRASVPGQLGAEGDNPFDIRLLSVAWDGGAEIPFAITLGRQPLNYGAQRLIGAFEWNNIGRVFDAVVFRFQQEAHRLDLFTASVVVPDRDGLDQSWFSGLGRRQILSGLYYTFSGWEDRILDSYLFWQSMEGGTDFATVGVRHVYQPGQGFDYGFEGVFQAGQVSGRELRAGAFHLHAGYTWEAPWQPRLGINYDYGSGDRSESDARTGTFQNLYPTNHLFYGYMDLFSWQNLNSPSVAFTVSPTSTTSFRAAWHLFWLATTRDAWYRANGVTQVRPITPEASSYVGNELDVTFTWSPVRWADLLVGYSRFFAGAYLRDTGPASDANFFYLQVGVNF